MFDWDDVWIMKPPVAAIIGLGAVPVSILFREGDSLEEGFFIYQVPTDDNHQVGVSPYIFETNQER
jgi:hypothetical protein